MEKLKRCVSAKNLATSEKKIIAFFRIINYYTDMRIITDFFCLLFYSPQSVHNHRIHDL